MKKEILKIQLEGPVRFHLTTIKNVPQEPYAEDPRAWRGCTWDPGRILSHRGAAAPRTPRSELSRFAPGPRAPNSQQKQHAGKQNQQKSNQE